MTLGRLNRRGFVSITTLALLAGCNIIPKAPVEPAPPPPPTSHFPGDKNRHHVALLVPLSGPNGALGQSLANATQMALLDTNARDLRITTYDTSRGPAAAATKAVAEGNQLILGPISSEAIAAVATVARASRVPLITYSSDPTAAARDVFIMGTTEGQSIARTVNFAAAHGMKRFGLLAPEGSYGDRAGVAFAQAVRAAGGTLVGSEGYARSNTSIVSAARRLRARGPLDAVMVADIPRYAVLAAPQLSANGKAPRLLGTELWAGESVVSTVSSLRGSLYSAVSDGRFGRFADSYKARFGAAPYRAATMGYDSVLLTIRIAHEWKPGTPFPTGRMLDTGGFLGLDGPFRFGGDGVIDRALEVREARSGGVTVVSPAPARFAD